jgi:hypothetical protein
MLEIVTRASSHRDERLAVSAKRMPRTLLFFVTLTAFSILFLLFFFPFGNLALGAISIALAAMLLYFANFVLRDLDNPFQGTWNVSVDPFNDLLAKAR